MRISFEEVESLRKRLNEIDSVPFGEVEWTRGGEPLVIPSGVADDWRFMGMGNSHFVELYEQLTIRGTAT